MFMMGSVLSRTGNDAWASRLSTMLTTYANKLQRPDGLFIHAAARWRCSRPWQSRCSGGR